MKVTKLPLTTTTTNTTTTTTTTNSNRVLLWYCVTSVHFQVSVHLSDAVGWMDDS